MFPLPGNQSVIGIVTVIVVNAPLVGLLNTIVVAK
jgi:hypothetical protein